jgi:phage terminase small subunit
MARTKGNHSAEYKRLRTSLLENLEARGMIEDVYTDKVQEYMNLWEQLQMLNADVAARGIAVMDDKRGCMAENRSVSLGVQVSRQLLAIFNALGFKGDPAAQKASAEDDEL